MVGLGNETYRAFLMTDVVGSTSLTQRDPVGYGKALLTHNQLAESTFQACGGKLLKSRGQGDGLLGEFESAADAVRAALAFQTALKAIPNPILTCRYSVHYGVCYGDGEDYFGHTLNLCARLRDIGHPDQILVSATVAELGQQLQLEGTSFYDLGWHGLKDMESATRIYQVDPADYHQPFLRLKTDSRFRLPTFGTQFVGRHVELDRISTILSNQQAVLLLGPGGIGKTRLAVRSAEIVAANQNCPCVFANLIEAVDAKSVEQVLAGTFGLRTTEELIKAINGDLIMIVDNCEHVANAAAEAVNILLQSLPNLRVIATSRVKMSLHSCTALNLDGLGVDEHGTASVDLFVQLAKTHDDAFELGPGDDALVQSICSAAEGVPLVIELAAFYVNRLSVKQIADRVFELVRKQTTKGRHSSIDAVLTGSVDTLEPETQQACGQLAWFAGGFTFEAANTMLGPKAEAALGNLIESSLLRFDRNAQPEPRYRFLEVIRVFMRDTLGGSTPGEPLIQWALTRSEELTNNLNDEHNRQELEVEMPNFRVALAAIAETDDKDLHGLKLATQLARFWVISGAVEGSHWLQTLLSKNPVPTEEYETLVMAANAHNRLGAIYYQQQNWTQANLAYLAARKFADQCGNRGISTSTKLNEGLILTEQGELERARPLLVEAEEYYRLEGQIYNWVTTLLNLGRLELREGNYARAEFFLLEGVKLTTEGPNLSVACCHLNLISCALLQGKDAQPNIDGLRSIEHILDIHNRAAFYYFMGLSAYSIGNNELERRFNARAEDLISQGASVNSFDLNLRSRVILK